MHGFLRRRLIRLLPWSLILLAVGCGRGDSDPADGHGHEHADDASRITAWSDDHEAFLEHPPLWAGGEAEVLIHVTNAADGSPRSAGAAELLAVSTDGPAGSTVVEAPQSRGSTTRSSPCPCPATGV